MAVTLLPLVITGAGGSTLIVKVLLPVPPIFVAVIVALVMPVEVAVPLITPATGSILKPAGKPVAPKLVGLLVAAIW